MCDKNGSPVQPLVEFFTSWMCEAMAAFVSKSRVWILSMYSSFFSHWK